MVNYQISQSTPFVHPDKVPGFDDFYDILIEEEEKLDASYVEALAHKDPLRLHQIVLDRGWEGLREPSNDWFTETSELELQACAQWVKNYLVFALVACEL